MKRKNNGREVARCKLVKMVITDPVRIIDVTEEVLDQFDRTDDSERIVVVAYLQVIKRDFLLVDRTRIFEFVMDTERKVITSDLFLLHKWLESAVSKCRNSNNPVQLQTKEEICVELFSEKIVLFKSRSSNKKRRN
jgi:hypothetical protein